ncbi:MAG: hypothetical protein Q8Q09_18905 [Deltaproteobacteria bacterium]|nr:hypothetical protein [Deltaproteobacteria bacterium]
MAASKIRELLVQRAHEIADEIERMTAPHERKRSRRVGPLSLAPVNDIDEAEAKALLRRAGWLKQSKQ